MCDRSEFIALLLKRYQDFFFASAARVRWGLVPSSRVDEDDLLQLCRMGIDRALSARPPDVDPESVEFLRLARTVVKRVVADEVRVHFRSKRTPTAERFPILRDGLFPGVSRELEDVEYHDLLEAVPKRLSPHSRAVWDLFCEPESTCYLSLRKAFAQGGRGGVRRFDRIAGEVRRVVRGLLDG